MCSLMLHEDVAMKYTAFLLIVTAGLLPADPLAAQFKPEFTMSIVASEDTSWGRAANRFAAAIKYRTQGRIQITNYFEGRAFAGAQTTEFQLLQEGAVDFAIGSTINWSPQVKELNLFALPFLFPSYAALDAVKAGDPGKRLFKLIEQKGVIPIAWGENGYRELTNSTRPIRRPEDLHGLNIRVVGIPIFIEIFRVLGANPVGMNFNEALEAFRLGKVDGQENPIALISGRCTSMSPSGTTPSIRRSSRSAPRLGRASVPRIDKSYKRPEPESWLSRRRKRGKDCKMTWLPSISLSRCIKWKWPTSRPRK